MEFSNKTLAWLVVATIVVSLAGTLISVNQLQGPTGKATFNTTGNASVTISAITQLNFKVSALDFGTGQVYANASTGYQCNLSNNKSTAITSTSGCTGFNTTNPAGSLTLENTGNLPLNVSLNFSANSTLFIGGGGAPNPLPLFRFTVQENETGSCPGGQNGYNTTQNMTWVDVPYGGVAAVPICNGSSAQNLQYADTADSMTIGIFIGIPANAAGSKNVTITALGTS